MDGGEISGNISGDRSGRVVLIGSGTFTMNGGEIYGNTSDGSGGGVALIGRETFTMNGGEIYGNTSGSNGGGVCLIHNGNFIMNGGEIYSNTGRGEGGGIGAAGTFTRIISSSKNTYDDIKQGERSRIFRIVTGTIYGSNEVNIDLRNNSNFGAAINTTVEYGIFDGSIWNKKGELLTTNDTIRVFNGKLR
jgi:hypothetical protein